MAYTINAPAADDPKTMRPRPVASYPEIKQVEGILSALGMDLEKYRLFAEETQARDQLLAQVNYENPSGDYRRILGSRLLARYKGDSLVEKTLGLYMARHPRYEIRMAALQNLLAMGLTGSTRELVSKASYGDVRWRFIAAFTLFKTGDPRGVPLLAVHAEDPVFGPLCAKPLETAILSKSEQKKNPSETMLAYWKRAVGWNTIPGKPHEVQNFQKAVDGLRVKDDDPVLREALENVVSADTQKVLRACYTLQRFTRRKVAFDALCRTARNHASENIRRRALDSLRAFRDFNPYAVCEHVLKNEQKDYIVNSAIDLTCVVQYAGFQNVLALAARHKSAAVRRGMADKIGYNKIKDAEAILYKLVRNDQNRGVKDAALYAMARMRLPKTLRLCQNYLSTGNRDDKYRAFRALEQYRDDKEALDILLRYQNDPMIGTRIKSHVQRYRKQP